MTTDEINQSRQLFPIKDGQFNELITFLNRADNVKYALQLPGESEMNSDKEKIKSSNSRTIINFLDYYSTRLKSVLTIVNWINQN